MSSDEQYKAFQEQLDKVLTKLEREVNDKRTEYAGEAGMTKIMSWIEQDPSLLKYAAAATGEVLMGLGMLDTPIASTVVMRVAVWIHEDRLELMRKKGLEL